MTKMTLILNKFTMVARKGQQKYYSIRAEDLEEDKEYFMKQDIENIKDQNEYEEVVKNQGLRNYTLGPVFNSFANDGTVEVYKSTYVIGEHAQISWIDSEGVWVFASRHASIFAKELEDLKAYNSTPTSVSYIPCMIAKFWFKYFDENINDKIGFQKALNGKTLCASYIDNSLFDSLIKYEAPTLIFNSIVENNSSKINCLTPGVSYRFFTKWGLIASPINKVGTYTDYISLINDVKLIHNKISNSSLHDDELGAVIYFVEKGEPDRVISMGKIETKQSIAFLSLAHMLKEFWKVNESFTSWNKALNSQYKSSFDIHISILKSLNIKDYDFYYNISKSAYDRLKEDLDLYHKLKTNLIGFFLNIIGKSRETKEMFVSTTLSKESDDISTQSLVGSRKNSSQFDEIHFPRSEDAIDRLMKNEHIRRQSNINTDEEERLEDIICSEASKSTPNKAKQIKKKKTKTKKPNNEKEDIKEVEIKENVPEEVEISEEIEKSCTIKTPEVKIYNAKIIARESALTSKDKKLRNLLMNKSIIVEAGFDKESWVLDCEESDVSTQNIYNAFVVEGDDIHNHVHLLSHMLKLGERSRRIYRSYNPFGLKKKRCSFKIKNIKSNETINLTGIYYDQYIEKDLLTQTFSEEALWKFFSNIKRRVYYFNQWIYFSNVCHWFAEFKIFSDFLEMIYRNFTELINYIVYPSSKYLYSPGYASHIFSSASGVTIPLFAMLSKPTKDFNKNLYQFIFSETKFQKKSKSKSQRIRIIERLNSFIDIGPKAFWDQIYDLNRPFLLPSPSALTEESKSSLNKIKKSGTKPKKTKAIKQSIESKAQSDDFCKLFQEHEKELTKVLDEKSQAKGKAFVVAKRPGGDTAEKPIKSGKKQTQKKEILTNEQDKNSKQKEDQAYQKKLEEEKKANKDKELKEKERKEKEDKSKRDKEIKDKKDKEDKELKEKQLRDKKEMELKEKQEKEEKALKEKELKDKQEQEAKAKQERELLEQQQKAQKERELKEKEEKLIKEMQEQEQELKEQKEREEKERKDKELKEQKEREEKQKEKELKEKLEKEEKIRKEKEDKEKLEILRKQEEDRKEQERIKELEKEKLNAEKEENDRIQKDKLDNEIKEKQEEKKREDILKKQEQKRQRQLESKQKKKQSKKQLLAQKNEKEEKLNDIEIKQKHEHDELIKDIENKRHKEEEMKLQKVEEDQKEHKKTLVHQIEENKIKEDQIKLDNIEHEQKHHHDDIVKEIQHKKEEDDLRKLDEIEKAQKEHHKEINKSIEDHRHEEDKKKLEEIEKVQKDYHKQLTKSIEENKHKEDERKLDEIEKVQKDHHKDLTKSIEELKHKEDEKKLSEIERKQKEHHQEINKSIQEIKHKEDEKKLEEIEKQQKDQHKKLTQAIEDHKHEEDNKKLEQIENTQKEHHKQLTKSIEEHKKQEDEKKLIDIENAQKEHHKELTQEIEEKKRQEDNKKLEQIENTQREHFNQIKKLIEDHKHQDDLQKLDEIEHKQKIQNEILHNQILENKKNLNQKRLEKIESDQKHHAEDVFKQINDLKKQADQRRLDEIEQQQKIELSNVVHQIHELPQSEDIEIIGSPIKSSDIPEYNKEFKIDPNEMEEEKAENKEFIEEEKEENQKSPFTCKIDLYEEKSPFSGSLRRTREERIIKRDSVPDKFKAKAVESKPKKITPRVKKTESAKIKPVLAVNPTTSKFVKEKSAYYAAPKPIPQTASKSVVSLKDIHYLGLKLTDNEEISYEKILNEQISYCLSRLIEKEPLEQLINMQKALEVGGLDQLGWTLPPMPFHITSTIINGKSTISNKKSIEEFKIGIEEKIDLRCIIIVEDLFVVALCNPKLVEVSTKIPYMALWVNGAKPKDCNTILEYILYKIKPSMSYGEEKLRTYYAIINKSILKDDIVGEVKINIDPYKAKRVWYCFIKDSVKLGFESFIKKLKDDD